MSDDPKSIGLSKTLLDYVVEHSGGADPVATELAVATREHFGDAAMNVEQDQGRFLEFLVGLIGARTIVEVGTFTGVSALFLARGLTADGRLICLDVEECFVDVGRPFWERAGMTDRIEVRIGSAAEGLAQLSGEVIADLVFIDADKISYGLYLDLALDLLSPDGLVVVDNVLWSGAVADDAVQDADTVALRSFNERVTGDPTLHSVMLGVGDGLSLIRVDDDVPHAGRRADAPREEEQAR